MKLYMSFTCFRHDLSNLVCGRKQLLGFELNCWIRHRLRTHSGTLQSISAGISNVPELCVNPRGKSCKGDLWERKAAGCQGRFVFGFINRKSNSEGRNWRQLGWLKYYSEVRKWRNENTTRSQQNSVAGRHQGSRLQSYMPRQLQHHDCYTNHLYTGGKDHRGYDDYHVQDKSKRFEPIERK